MLVLTQPPLEPSVPVTIPAIQGDQSKPKHNPVLMRPTETTPALRLLSTMFQTSPAPTTPNDSPQTQQLALALQVEPLYKPPSPQQYTHTSNKKVYTRQKPTTLVHCKLDAHK
eukprot:11240857-Ditylum_brightwellii.AAC.1